MMNNGLANQQTQNLAWQYLYFLCKYYDPSAAETILPWAHDDFPGLDDDDVKAQIEHLFLDCGCFPAFSETPTMAAGCAHSKKKEE
jgi:hypothetical protein